MLFHHLSHLQSLQTTLKLFTTDADGQGLLPSFSGPNYCYSIICPVYRVFKRLKLFTTDADGRLKPPPLEFWPQLLLCHHLSHPKFRAFKRLKLFTTDADGRLKPPPLVFWWL